MLFRKNKLIKTQIRVQLFKADLILYRKKLWKIRIIWMKNPLERKISQKILTQPLFEKGFPNRKI